MTKSLLAIVLAAATLPLTFAQANPPVKQDSAKTDTKTAAPAKTKKHSSKNTKGKKGTASKTPTTPANPPQK